MKRAYARRSSESLDRSGGWRRDGARGTLIGRCAGWESGAIALPEAALNGSNRAMGHFPGCGAAVGLADGALADVQLVPRGVSGEAGDGKLRRGNKRRRATLYFVQGQISWRGQPKSARIMMARRTVGAFVLDAASEAVFGTVDEEGLDDPPATGADELKMVFTRSDPQVGHGLPGSI